LAGPAGRESNPNATARNNPPRAACRRTSAPCIPKHPVRSAPQECPVEAVSEQQPFRQERPESLFNTFKQDFDQLVWK
jgi:hypothetical protein